MKLDSVIKNQFQIDGALTSPLDHYDVAAEYASLVTESEFGNEEANFVQAWFSVSEEEKRALSQIGDILGRAMFNYAVLTPEMIPPILYVDGEKDKLIKAINGLGNHIRFVKFLVICRLLYGAEVSELFPDHRKELIIADLQSQAHSDIARSDLPDALEFAFFTKLAFPDEDVYSMIPELYRVIAIERLADPALVYYAPEILSFLKVLSPTLFRTYDLHKYGLDQPEKFIISERNKSTGIKQVMSKATTLLMLDPQFDLMNYVWTRDPHVTLLTEKSEPLPPLVIYA